MVSSLRPRQGLKTRAFIGGVLLLAVLIGCQKKKSGGLGLPDDATNQDTSGSAELGPTIDASDLSSGDKEALGNLAQETNTVEPEDDGKGLISDALKQEMDQLLKDEKEGRDVAVQKMALAGKMMTECAQRVATFVPVPGQPLLGSWGGQACPVPSGKFVVPGPAIGFAIDDPAGLGPGKGRKPGAPTTYTVSGGTAGSMAASPDGKGAIQGSWAGPVADSGLNGKSGAGTVVNPQYSSTKYGHSPCSMGVSLQSSRNPIPENYVEGMRMAGKCFRQTLVLISPTMDQVFKGMDPQLASLLRMKMLGISPGNSGGQGNQANPPAK